MLYFVNSDNFISHILFLEITLFNLTFVVKLGSFADRPTHSLKNHQPRAGGFNI